MYIDICLELTFFMKKFKHKKIRNTGMLFELLTRKLTSEVLKNNKPRSLSLIQKYFTEGSELGKELGLYKLLVSEKAPNKEYATELITVVLESRKALDESKLADQKYKLIKELKSVYRDQDIQSLFNTRLKDYATLASIYNIFENKKEDSPKEFLVNKIKIAEHILENSKKKVISESDYLSDKDKELRSLTFKFLVDKFNNKWKNLSEHQVRLLKEYINNPTDSTYFRKFIKQETDFIEKVISAIIKEGKIPDRSLVVKLKNIIPYLKTISESRYIKEEHILSLMRYHEVIYELKAHK